MIQVDTRVGANLVDPVPDYQRLVWAEQVNTVTGGQITLPRSSPALATLLGASATSATVGLLITDENGWRTSCHVTAEKVTATERSVIIPFRTDTALINEVPAFPNPADPANPWGTTAYWTYTGAAVTVVADFIATHGGPGSHPDWRRFDAVVTSGTGPTVTFKARMEPSLDYIAARTRGAAIVSAYLAGGQAVVGVRAQVDRPDVVFSADLNTLDDFVWTNTMPAANTIYAGGTGVGTARAIAVASTATALWPRKRGVFIDRGNSTGADLAQAAADAAAWPGPTLQITATDTPGTAYGADWQLGDTVRADVLGTRHTLPVTGVTTTASPGRVARSIVLGAPTFDATETLALKREFITRYGLQEFH